MKHIIGSLILTIASVLMVGAYAQKGGALLDLNTATEAQINALPSVGNKVAAAIFKNRPYTSLADLSSKVKLSKKTLDKITPLISFNGVAASANPVVAANNGIATAVAGAAVAANTQTGVANNNAQAGSKPSKASKNTATTANPINVNTASRDELMSIPEVGPKLADAIIANRPYKDMAEMIKKVKGIGPKNSIKLAPFMRF